MDCLFCKIADKEIPGDIVYEDELVLAFKDIAPAAPTHILIIPKEHIASLNGVTDEHASLLSHIMLHAGDIAKKAGLAENGWRLVANIGEDGGQTVNHLHFHILGGRKFTWPPG